MNYLRCDGNINFDALDRVACDNWTIVSQDELLSLAPVTQLVELLNAAFATPSAGEITAAFLAAFTLPLICYLTAWGFQSLISFVK